VSLRQVSDWTSLKWWCTPWFILIYFFIHSLIFFLIHLSRDRCITICCWLEIGVETILYLRRFLMFPKNSEGFRTRIDTSLNPMHSTHSVPKSDTSPNTNQGAFSYKVICATWESNTFSALHQRLIRNKCKVVTAKVNLSQKFP
jgi:hypothetical protein